MGGIYLDIGGPHVLDIFLPELHRSFGESLPLDAYKEQIVGRLAHPWAKDAVRVLVLRDERGNYLSHLHLHALRALCFDREIWMGGIDSLVTPERVRRQGHATALLRLTLELLAREGVEGAFLFSDFEGGLFDTLGFRVIPAPNVDVSLVALPEEIRDGIEVRVIRSKDWSSIAAIYQHASSGQPLWFLRDRDRWDYLVAQWSGKGAPDGLIGFVAEGEHGIAGYLLGHVDRDDVRLLEYGMQSPSRETFSSLLARMRVEGERRGCTRLTSPWPPMLRAAPFDSIFRPGPAAPSRLLVASLDRRLDLDPVVSQMQGYWEFERI